jgi:hypothetical protein
VNSFAIKTKKSPAPGIEEKARAPAEFELVDPMPPFMTEKRLVIEALVSLHGKTSLQARA